MSGMWTVGGQEPHSRAGSPQNVLVARAVGRYQRITEHIISQRMALIRYKHCHGLQTKAPQAGPLGARQQPQDGQDEIREDDERRG